MSASAYKESYFCVRCRADDWKESQKQVADAFSQAPHLPHEPDATTIRVAHGSRSSAPGFPCRSPLRLPMNDYSEPRSLGTGNVGREKGPSPSTAAETEHQRLHQRKRPMAMMPSRWLSLPNMFTASAVHGIGWPLLG